MPLFKMIQISRRVSAGMSVVSGHAVDQEADTIRMTLTDLLRIRIVQISMMELSHYCFSILNFHVFAAKAIRFGYVKSSKCFQEKSMSLIPTRRRNK